MLIILRAKFQLFRKNWNSIRHKWSTNRGQSLAVSPSHPTISGDEGHTPPFSSNSYSVLINFLHSFAPKLSISGVRITSKCLWHNRTPLNRHNHKPITRSKGTIRFHSSHPKPYSRKETRRSRNKIPRSRKLSSESRRWP